MDFNRLTEQIQDELQRPLPGKPVQMIMSSIQRIRQLFTTDELEKAKKSGVLILLYPHLDSTMFVVTQRPVYDGIHSGQVSLPGGRFESTDKDLEDTALRETFEEIGVTRKDIRIIGTLTELYIPPSNYIVQPFIGVTEKKPVFIPHPKEVKEIIEIPLSELMDNKNMAKRNLLVRGMEILAPCFVIKDVTIWGATAMILSEFREVVKRAVTRR